MLLRSSSTPVLGSLMPSISHLDGGNDGDCEIGASLHADSGKRLFFPAAQPCFQSFSSFASPSSRHMTSAYSDVGSLDGSSQDFDGEVVPWSNFRRAQSETDLRSLGRSSSAPVKATVESLFQGVDPDYDGLHVSSSQRQWSRRLAAPARLQSIPSFSFHGSGNESEGDEDIDENGPNSNPNTFIAGENKLTDLVNNVDLGNGSNLRDFSSQMDRALDARELQNLTGVQDEREIMKPIAGQERSDAMKIVAPKEDFEAVPEAKLSEVPKCGVGDLYSYGVEIGQNGMASVRKAGVYNEEPPLLFMAGGLGMDVTEPLTAIGDGSGGKSFRKFTGGTGDGFGADSNNIDEYYQRMLENNPGNPVYLGNYGQFLYEIKHDSDKAEYYYSRAILAEPGDGEVLSQYAKLIWEIHRDKNRASSYFEQAVQASPESCNVLAAYASFLWDIEKDDQEQEHSSFDSMPSLYGAVTSMHT